MYNTTGNETPSGKTNILHLKKETKNLS